jgi:hypothetical protein
MAEMSDAWKLVRMTKWISFLYISVELAWNWSTPRPTSRVQGVMV